MTLAFDLRVARGPFRLEAAASAAVPGVVALFGRSGSGKTTLAHALAGLGPRPGGWLRLGATTWLDRERRIEVPAERRGIGYVFQDGRLFPHLDVLGNLRYGARRVRDTTPYVREDELVVLLGLEGLLGRRVHALSGGERSRVALGRALLAQPRLLLLDEPFAALDAPRREELLTYLERVRDRYAVPMVYVSHRYEEVLRLASEVLLLEAGRVVATGAPQHLARHPELRAIAGADAVGAVLDADVVAVGVDGLATVRLGGGTLRLPAAGGAPASRLRVHIPARDVVLAIEAPRGLSVRNELRGTIAALEDESEDAVIVTVDCAGDAVLARVTRTAVRELALAPGQAAWVLIKAASLRGHAYGRPEGP